MNTNIRWGRVYLAVFLAYEGTLTLLGTYIFLVAFMEIPNITINQALELTWNAFVAMYQIGPLARTLFTGFPVLFVATLFVKKEERTTPLSLETVYNAIIHVAFFIEGMLLMSRYWAATGTFQTVSPTYVQLSTAVTGWLTEAPHEMSVAFLSLAAFFMALDFGLKQSKNHKVDYLEYLD